MKFDESRPIWWQIYEEFMIQIVTGNWPSGSKIPSVREIAVTITVNPNTIQKAFGEIERVGLVKTERASARFVTQDEKLITMQRIKMAQRAAKEYVNTVKRLQLDLTTIVALVEKSWEQS